MEQRFGGFWIRFLAYVIDAVIVGGVSYALAALTGQSDNLFRALGLLYFIIMPVTNMQATIGKSVLGLKITDKDGEKISVGRSIGRYFSYFISAIILLIGFMMIGWTKNKQGLHDIIAGTYVMKK